MDRELQIATWGLLADNLLKENYEEETRNIVRSIAITNINYLRKKLKISNASILLAPDLRGEVIDEKYEDMISRTTSNDEETLLNFSGIYTTAVYGSDENFANLKEMLIDLSVNNILEICSKMPPVEGKDSREKYIPKNVVNLIGEYYGRENKKR